MLGNVARLPYRPTLTTIAALTTTKCLSHRHYAAGLRTIIIGQHNLAIKWTRHGRRRGGAGTRSGTDCGPEIVATGNDRNHGHEREAKAGAVNARGAAF